MTLNNVIQRIQTISLAHKQVRSFYHGMVTDSLVDHTKQYPAVFLYDTGGKISTAGHATTLNFKMLLLDLVHVSQDSKLNELDVQSDMISVAMDIVAQMNNQNYQDWFLSTDNNLQLLAEEKDDLCAGVALDFSLRIIFNQDRCQIPSDIITIDPLPSNDNKVYDLKYIADGTEGNTLPTDDSTNYPELTVLNGKKILFVTREFSPLYRVSSDPGSVEYTWDNTDIVLNASLPAQAGEKFLFLYRNY